MLYYLSAVGFVLGPGQLWETVEWLLLGHGPRKSSFYLGALWSTSRGGTFMPSYPHKTRITAVWYLE